MKNIWKKHRNKIVIALVAVVILGTAWIQGSKHIAAAPALPEETGAAQITALPTYETVSPVDDAAVSVTATATPTMEAVSATPAVTAIETPISAAASADPQPSPPEPSTGTAAENDTYMTSPVPEGNPDPVEPQDTVIGTTAMTCTLSVQCSMILDNISNLNPDKTELVPEDGVIFPPTVVTFYEGESVFNVLQREMKRALIHLEFVNTPIYNSAYIEGINNLYEFDCGSLSGWMYSVNGWFPNYGCSRYSIQSGDVIEWIYTCDLGREIGGYYATGG